jgi:hypothetical protein
MICVSMMSATMVVAQDATSPAFRTDWMELALASIGGLAFFLFGVAQLADGLRAAAGPKVEALLRHATEGPVRVWYPGRRQPPFSIPPPSPSSC